MSTKNDVDFFKDNYFDLNIICIVKPHNVNIFLDKKKNLIIQVNQKNSAGINSQLCFCLSM